MVTTKGEKNISKKLTKKDQEKIESLKDIVEEAEKSLYSAKAMLVRLEGKGKPESVQKKTYGTSPNGQIVEGVFDGQIMISNDGKQYPVPANYASKSKLVEGDMLKLTMTDEGNFVYKQIGPVERKHLVGTIREDESGNYIVQAEGGTYKVLLASVTYYRAQPGDEVAIIIPRNGEPVWSAIENVIKKDSDARKVETDTSEDQERDPFMNNILGEKQESEEETSTKSTKAEKVVEEWTPKLSELEKETEKIEKSTKKMAKDSKKKNDKNKNEDKDSLISPLNSVETGEKIPIRVDSVGKADPREDFLTGEESQEKVVREDFPDTPEEFFKS
ncbi:MAG: hypothetical protein U9Q72_02205 [Patescibacteria group bacterium]|nr:hypothetical protein [Patescibacteria group bacterium]